jgi:DNA polymerase elongation subunit (family B)
MDTYRKKNTIVIWIKNEKNLKIEMPYSSYIYLSETARDFLIKNKIAHSCVRRKNYLRKTLDVCEVKVSNLFHYESLVRQIEKAGNYRIPMYDADIAPEQMFLYQNGLIPFSLVEIGSKIVSHGPAEISLVELHLHFNLDFTRIIFNGMTIEGSTRSVLTRFTKKFKFLDPDVILLPRAFYKLPLIVSKLEEYDLRVSFHRWDKQKIKYKGGKSFFSYGNVIYRDYGIRLHGRFLIDTDSIMFKECNMYGIIELCQLSGARLQQIASKSFGATFQFAIVKELVKNNLLVPYKEKPVDKPLSLSNLLKSDRVGHTLDAKLGFHKNVAEIDFCSMYPWIIFNNNISADTILCEEGPYEQVPRIPLKISWYRKGLVPQAIKPFLDRRMEYKKTKNPRAAGLKWVLVTSFGYLRYREFKLGIPSTHMAIGAYAREIMVRAMHEAEKRNFYPVHGIIDSLYLKNITEDEAKTFCRDLEFIEGIPISYEGIFKWIIFVPSVSDEDRPVPTRYFGVYTDGRLKVRGLEVRQSNVALIVKKFQQKVLDSLIECETRKDILEKLPHFCKILKKIDFDSELLVAKVKLKKTEYKHNCVQNKLLRQLKNKGMEVLPGHTVPFIYQKNKPVLVEDYNGKPDKKKYTELLVRSLFAIYYPLGVSKQLILDLVGLQRQTRINEFVYGVIPHFYFPIGKHTERKGLSEKIFKRKLEKEGWTVWRGGLFNILKKQEIYPNVRRKYEKLLELFKKYHKDLLPSLQYIDYVHHGLPDFVCFRNGRFKFVECKLGHEQLNSRQKKTLTRLQELGFEVEVHKLVDPCTKVRKTYLNLNTSYKKVLDRQLALTTIK